MLSKSDRLNLVERLRSSDVSVPNISDALDYLGASNQVLLNLHPRTNVYRSVGRATLVEWRKQRKHGSILEHQKSTWSSVRDFILPDCSNSCSGKVYVAGSSFGIHDEALLGGLSTTYLIEQLGFESIVLAGAIRDVEDLADIDAPVFSSSLSPIDTQGAYEAIADVPQLTLCNVSISSGDIIITDENGVAAIPQEIELEVIDKAIELKKREDALMQMIKQGNSLPSLIEQTGHI